MRYSILILLCAVSTGCNSTRKTDVLEARLREQQQQATQLAEQLTRADADLAVAQQESNILRQQLTANGAQPLQPEQSDVLYRMAKLRIDPLQSSILPVGNSDSSLINVVITPVDQFDEPLKLPGDITVELLEEKPSGNTLLGSHDFPAAQVRKKWSAGWVSSGFVFQFPWPEKHAIAEYSEKKLVLKATFKTADGREFVATNRLKINNHVRLAVDSVAASSQKTELKQSNFEQTEAAAKRIDTSDRRTIDEFPIFR